MPPRHNQAPSHGHNDFQDSSPQPLQSEIVVHEKIDVPGLHPFFHIAYQEAQNGFGSRIDMSSFTNRKDLAKDVARVQEKLSIIRDKCLHGSENEKMAYVQSDIFEHMLHKHIVEAKWFGEDVKSILPSVYDDLFNGVDLILEQNVGEGAFAFSSLAVDATFSAKGAVEKIDRTMKNLHDGSLGRIKYFKSEAANFKGRIDNVPHFVIGVGRPALFEMVGQYVQKGAIPEINQEARRMILEQIERQSVHYANFLISRGFTSEASQYSRVGDNVRKILIDTSPLSNKKGIDEVHRAIMECCKIKSY